MEEYKLMHEVQERQKIIFQIKLNAGIHGRVHAW